MFKEGLSDLKKLLYNKNVIIAFVVLAFLGFIFGYYVTEMLGAGEGPGQNEIQLPGNANKDLTLEEKNPSNAVLKDLPKEVEMIKENTLLIFQREYVKSNEIDEETQTPEKELVGLTKKQFKQLYKQWEIVKFDEKEIILHTKIDSYSPRFYKVGMAEKNDQQYIAVFNFDKEGQEVLKYISTTPIAMLNEIEKNKFKEGVILDNIQDVHGMLENYDG